MARPTSKPAIAALILAVSPLAAHTPVNGAFPLRAERFSAPLTAEPAQKTQPNWDRIPDLCRQLRAEGWRPPPDGIGSPETGERVVGGSLKIFHCHLRRTLPGAGKGATVTALMQLRGGNGLSLRAELWSEAQRTATLDAAAQDIARLARDLNITLPGGLAQAVRTAEAFQDEDGNLTFRIRIDTREEELRIQPDLKPQDVPLLAVEIEVEPEPRVRVPSTPPFDSR